MTVLFSFHFHCRAKLYPDSWRRFCVFKDIYLKPPRVWFMYLQIQNFMGTPLKFWFHLICIRVIHSYLGPHHFVMRQHSEPWKWDWNPFYGSRCGWQSIIPRSLAGPTTKWTFTCAWLLKVPDWWACKACWPTVLGPISLGPISPFGGLKTHLELTAGSRHFLHHPGWNTSCVFIAWFVVCAYGFCMLTCPIQMFWTVEMSPAGPCWEDEVSTTWPRMISLQVSCSGIVNFSRKQALILLTIPVDPGI